jgi:hypothetical protein
LSQRAGTSLQHCQRNGRQEYQLYFHVYSSNS